MSFLDSLNNLQNASVGKRKFVAGFLVVTIMLFIGVLWILQLRIRTYANENKDSSSATEPFKVLWNAIKPGETDK